MSRSRVLPDHLSGPGGLELRCWVADDAEALGRAVAESADHLRPWMEWVSQEPLSIPERRATIEGWERRRLEHGDALMGIFIDGQVAGACGLHRRIGPRGLEIGYWVHPAFLRRGIATTASALLTDAAFGLDWIKHVEIHHDKANLASRGIPEKLGYTLIDEVPDRVEAPAETGISCRWRMTRLEWEGRRKSP